MGSAVCQSCFFVLLFVTTGRTLGDPYNLVNYSIADNISNAIYGYGNVGGEQIDDVYFYIDIVTVIVITITIYWVILKTIHRIRISFSR